MPLERAPCGPCVLSGKPTFFDGRDASGCVDESCDRGASFNWRPCGLMGEAAGDWKVLLALPSLGPRTMTLRITPVRWYRIPMP